MIFWYGLVWGFILGGFTIWLLLAGKEEIKLGVAVVFCLGIFLAGFEVGVCWGWGRLVMVWYV